MKKNKMLAKIVVLSLITVSILYASGLVQLNHTLPQEAYHTIDIAELQEAVEQRTQNGDLPFDMGLELMKRWTQK